MPFGPRKSTVNLHNPTWQIQIPVCSIWDIINFWTLQPPHGGSFGRTVRILPHCWWHSHIWPGHRRTCQPFLQRCADMNITLNMEKCKFCQTKVTLLDFGCLLRATKLTNQLLMPYTASRHPPAAPICTHFWVGKPAIHMQQFHGIIVDSPAPFAQHTKRFCMDTAPWRCFHEGQRVPHYSSKIIIFDLNKSTRLCTDASRQGLGFILQQKSTDGTWTLVQAGSRFLSDAESRYATIELEMLAVCLAMLNARSSYQDYSTL